MGRRPRLPAPRKLPRPQPHGSYVPPFQLPHQPPATNNPATAVGRWQKNKDLGWYAKGDTSAAAVSAAEARKLEIARIKEAEESALSEALGYGPTVKSNPNEMPVGRKEVERVVREMAGGEEEGGAKGVGFGAFVGGKGMGEEGDVLGGEGLEGDGGGVVRDGDGRRERKRRSRSRDGSRERRYRRHTRGEERAHKRYRSRDRSFRRPTDRSRERYSYRRERSRSYERRRDDDRPLRRPRERSSSPGLPRRRGHSRDRYDYRR